MKSLLFAAVASASERTTDEAWVGKAALGAACDATWDNSGCAEGTRCATAGGPAPAVAAWAFTADANAPSGTNPSGDKALAGSSILTGTACGDATVITQTTYYAGDGTDGVVIYSDANGTAITPPANCPATAAASSWDSTSDAAAEAVTTTPGICLADVDCGTTRWNDVEIVCSAAKLGAGILATLTLYYGTL